MVVDWEKGDINMYSKIIYPDSDTQTLGCKTPNKCMWCNAEIPNDVLFQEKHMQHVHGLEV